MNKNLRLLSVITLSFLSIITYSSNPQVIQDTYLDYFRLMAPGILFTVYLLWVYRKKTSVRKSLLSFFILIVFYWGAVYLGMRSMGFAVPFVAGIGALIIKGVFENIQDSNAVAYFFNGFVAGLVGLIFFYVMSINYGIIPLGAGLGFIIVLWQYIIGKKIMKSW